MSRLEQVKRDIRLLKEEEARLIAEQETYCEGDRFVDKYGLPYMLIYNGKASLVDVRSGHYWSPGCPVADCCRITKAEFDKISSTGKFTKVDVPYAKRR